MKNVTQSFGLIGLICILFAAASFVVTRTRSPFFYGELSLGVALIIAYIVLHSKAFFGFFGKKSTHHGSHTFVYSLIIFLLIAALNYLSYDRWHKSFDLTEQKVFSLADQSLTISKNIVEPVEITAFFKDVNPAVDQIRQILQRYRNQNSKISFSFVDPDANPGITKNAGAEDGQLYFKSGLQTHLVKELSEENITNALIKIGRVEKQTVYALTSHGCRSLAEGEKNKPPAAGISFLKKAIENEGYTFKELKDLAKAVPEDADVLLIAGPKQPFEQADVKKIADFAERGGQLMILLDPILPDPRFATTFSVLETGLEEFFMERGVVVGKDMILEQRMETMLGMDTALSVKAVNYGVSPITEKLKNMITYFLEVRSLQKVYNNTFNGTVTELVRSAGQGASWAERDIDGLLKNKSAKADAKDLQGPVTVAMSIARHQSQPKLEDGEDEEDEMSQAQPQLPAYRIVVVGDSDFATNDKIVRYPANQDFFLNSLNWLAGQEEQISIRPRRIKSSHLVLDAKKTNAILYVAVLGIPQLIMIFGLIIWIWRRKK